MSINNQAQHIKTHTYSLKVSWNEKICKKKTKKKWIMRLTVINKGETFYTMFSNQCAVVYMESKDLLKCGLVIMIYLIKFLKILERC